jgi:hypothetical protein
VLDETGKVLLHLEPPDDQKVIHVPAADVGGREGKIIRMKASWELNTLIDRFDQQHVRYDVKATVQTIGPDANPFDNSKVKSWNIPFGVRPRLLNVYNDIYANNGDQPAKVHWQFEHTPYPNGWEIKGVPASQEPFVLNLAKKFVGI